MNPPPAAMPLPCEAAPDLFFSERQADADRAKALCRRCPIREACLAGAIKRREPWGVWGGQDFTEGRPRRYGRAARAEGGG